VIKAESQAVLNTLTENDFQHAFKGSGFHYDRVHRKDKIKQNIHHNMQINPRTGYFKAAVSKRNAQTCLISEFHIIIFKSLVPTNIFFGNY
jgi:hypothetical protein